MNATDTYRSWIEKRRAVEVGRGFASVVMARIQLEDIRPTDQGDRTASRWPAIAACVLAAMILALFRGLSACLALLAISGHAS